MKKIILTLCFLATTHSFAMSCPSNGEFIDIGYDEAQILKLCGQPISTDSYTTTTNLNEEWVYYKNVGALRNKVTMLFNEGRLTNINILDTAFKQVCTNQECQSRERNVATSGICGQILQVGAGTGYVRSICGSPASQSVSANKTDEMKEFKYEAPGPSILVMKNGKLLNWK